MSKERIEKLEKEVEEIKRQRAIEQEVERVINNQKTGLFRYLFDGLKIIAALILLTTGGDHVLDQYPWIKDLIK